MFGYQSLMQETYLAHEDFKKEWKDWRNGNLKKDKKGTGCLEPVKVTAARDNFDHKLDALYGSKIEPLEKKFLDNPKSAMDELIEFLSTDITAFRCGYAKEIFLQWLKNTEISAKEIKQLQQVAIKMCETNNVRREFRRWCRLAIKLADKEFILELMQLLKSENVYTRIKSRWMIELIQKHRLDLRKQQKSNEC